MTNKNIISKSLLVIALLFTVLFQLLHGFSHYYSAVFSEDHHVLATWHSDDHHQEQVADNGHAAEKCFACDFILSPFTPAVNAEVNFFICEYFAQNPATLAVARCGITPVFAALRAPPVQI